MRVKLFRHLKLMQKFLLSYFMLIIIPLFLLSTITYNKVSEIIENHITFSTEQAIDQTYSFLSYKLHRIANVSDIVRVDNTLVTILDKSPVNYALSEQVSDMTYLRNYISSFEDSNDIYRVRLYVRDDFIYSAENVNIFTISRAKNSSWYAVLKESNVKNFWAPSTYLEGGYKEPKLLSVSGAVRNPNNYQTDIGYVRVDFKKQLIEEIIKKANSTDGSFSYIENSNGNIIASSDDSLIDRYRISISSAESLAKQRKKLNSISINKEDCLVSSSIIDNTDWYMITVVPYSSILSGSKAIRNDLILIMIVIGTIAYSLAFYFSKSLNNRISKLIKAMRKVYSGDLNTYIADSNKDEIGELIEDYNFMIKKMAVLIEEQYKTGKEVKNAELKALQSQINPHFLYNTLDMINWMALKNMNTEISEAVRSLAKFYKLSLSKGKDTISIKDEVAHVSLYVQIQNMRYSNRISFKLDVDEEIFNYSILKITLQPIVENSILHGILGKGSENGEIVISSIIENDDIILYVKDDGIGISEESIKKILSGDINSKKGSGYGIKNINQRIKLYYGESYGLAFKSELGKGTTVEIRVPAIKY